MTTRTEADATSVQSVGAVDATRPNGVRSMELDLALPECYRTVRGRGLLDVRHEEDALCWFWAFPELFPWPRPVSWLYTPVTGRDQWPGDLWGVDADGELLIIECKQCRRADDPFHDFVAYHREGRHEFTAGHWLEKWQKHLRQEVKLESATLKRTGSKKGGMLPRSNGRDHIRRWPELARLIDAHIRSEKYQRAVERALAAREARANPNPRPHYVGLVVKSGDSRLLTESAEESVNQLKALVGEERVHTVVTQGEVLEGGRIRVSAWRIGG